MESGEDDAGPGEESISGGLAFPEAMTQPTSLFSKSSDATQSANGSWDGLGWDCPSVSCKGIMGQRRLPAPQSPTPHEKDRQPHKHPRVREWWSSEQLDTAPWIREQNPLIHPLPRTYNTNVRTATFLYRESSTPYIVMDVVEVDEYCVVLSGLFGKRMEKTETPLAEGESATTSSTAAIPMPERQAHTRVIKKVVQNFTHPPNENKKGLRMWLGRLMYVCWIGCCPPLPSPVIHKIVFMPPPGISYRFQAPDGEFLDSRNIRRYAGKGLCFRISYPLPKHAPPAPLSPDDTENREQLSTNLSHFKGRLVRTAAGSVVAVAILETPDPRFLILFSHANACDLGEVLSVMYSMRRRLRCSVVSYDYSGYGLSTGRRTETNFYADAEAVYASIAADGLATGGGIISLGFSLGTAAAAHLGAIKPGLAAVVLAGSFISAINCIRAKPASEGYPCRRLDKFRTYERVGRIRAPTLVLHGLNDKITRVEHGLWNLAHLRQPLLPLFLPDTRHNDLMEKPAVWLWLDDLVRKHLPERRAATSADSEGGHRIEEAFRNFLSQLVPDLEAACLRSANLCRACVRRVMDAFLDPATRDDSLSVPDHFRYLRWQVTEVHNKDSGWLAHFSLVAFTAFHDQDEVTAFTADMDLAQPTRTSNS